MNGDEDTDLGNKNLFSLELKHLTKREQAREGLIMNVNGEVLREGRRRGGKSILNRYAKCR